LKTEIQYSTWNLIPKTLYQTQLSSRR